MGKGVIFNGMSFFGDGFDDLRILKAAFSDGEKSGFNIFPFERFQYRICFFGIGTVVESEGDEFFV